MGKAHSPTALKKSKSSPAMSSPVKKQQRCRECKGCKRENCGKCKNCLSMVAFGGEGKRKAKCVERVCEKMQSVTPSSGQKSAQNSPKLKTVASAPTLKNKDLNACKATSGKDLKASKASSGKDLSKASSGKDLSKASSGKDLSKASSGKDLNILAGGKISKESAEACQPSKKKVEDTKSPQVNKKIQTVCVAAVAQTEKTKKKTSDKEKTSQTSPKTKPSGSQSLQPSPKVKPIYKTLLNPQYEKDTNQTSQKSPLTKSESVKGAQLRFSPRVKAINQSVSEKSPNVKQAGADDLENNNVKADGSDMKVSTRNFYASTTRSKAVDEGSLKRRKSTENESEEKQIDEDANTNKECEAKKPSEVKGTVSEISGACASATSERATTVAVKKDIDLPTLKLDSMSKSELKEFIPKLLKLVTGKEEVFYSRRSAKPEWWPEDVAWAASRSAWYSEKYWTDNLKSVVKNCYKHVGKENLLRDQDRLVSENMQTEDSVKTGSYPSSPVKIRMFPQDLFLPFSAEIYICFFCEKEFLSKEVMRNHQKGCKERPPDLLKVCSDIATCDTVQSVQPPTMSPKKSVDKVWSKLSLDKFTSHLGLVPKLTAAKLREQRPSIDEINCEILDDIEPVSPVTPKTPKSLISQLSREDSGHASRKRLSYSLSMDSHKDDGNVYSDSESDSESETGKEQKPVHEMNLLDIPISSLLGHRIKNYVHVDTPMSIVEDTSSFCRTPVKNTFLEKLRKKPLAYPILYRPRRIANLHKQNHIYRFKKAEVKEFMCKINTGLNSASLEKLHSMKKFSIRLQRLSRKRLLSWMSRNVLDKQLRGVFKGLKYLPYSESDSTVCEFPSGPTLLVKNIDKLLGLKKRTSQESSKMSLSLSNFISEEMEAEVSKQKLTLYRSLLYEMSVLKPAVVMEDIRGQAKSTQSDYQDEKQTVSSVKGMDDLEKSEGKEVKPRSIFRDVCRRSREERLMAEAEERERKDEYQTLKALLTAPRSHNNFTSVMMKVQQKTPLSQALPVVKSDKRSPNDDTVSIMSGSSEGESLHSNCCNGCSDKKQRLVSHEVAKQENVNQVKSLSPPFIQPLHVDVDLSGTPKIDDYGIPSPLSISSESPFPPTPSKSNSGLLDNSGKSMDSVESSPSSRRETRSTRSSGLLVLSNDNASSQSERPVFSLSCPKTESRTNEGSLQETTSTLKLLLSSGIKTRSCSGTPSGSPVKRMTRSGSSAPTSPSKASKLNKSAFDVKQVSRKLEIPASLQNSNLDFRKLRSGSVASQTELEKISPQKQERSVTSPQSSAVSNKPNSGISSVTKNTSQGNMNRESVMGDGQLRRSKRKSSCLLEEVQSSKLRKVKSDLTVTTR